MPSVSPSITLRITKSPQSAAPKDAVKVFDECGGTIGRAEGSDWVLPDATRQVSGRHATVRYDGGKFQLIDTSSNGVFLNDDGEPLGSERVADLKDGDRLTVGAYELVVSLETFKPAAATVKPAVMAQEIAPGCDARKPLDPLELLRDAGAQEAFSAVNAQTSLATAPSPCASMNASAGRSLGAHANHATAAQPFASLSLGCEEAVDPLQLLGDAGVSPSPIALKPRGERALTAIGAQRDDAPIVASHYRVPAAIDLVPEDWDLHAAPAIDAPPAPPGIPSQPTNAIKPIGSDALSASLPSQVGAGCAAKHALDSKSAVRILLEGAGLDSSLVEKLDAARTLELAGRLLRVAVGGVRELLLARATLKTGFHVPVTMIAPKDNNPLKFSAGGVSEVMETLLLDRGKAYVPAVEAMEQGLEDLKDHQLALMAGMRSSLDALLETFDPARIEAVSERLGKRGLLSNRKAHCWDIYCARFDETIKAAEERFRDLFGKPFAAGYQSQARKRAATRAADAREIRNGME